MLGYSYNLTGHGAVRQRKTKISAEQAARKRFSKLCLINLP